MEFNVEHKVFCVYRVNKKADKKHEFEHITCFEDVYKAQAYGIKRGFKFIIKPGIIWTTKDWKWE